MPIGTTVGEPQHERVLLRYKGYELDILHFRWFDEKGIAIHLHFKTRKKWWHGIFKDQSAELIGDLKGICAREISHLTFERYEYTNKEVECVYFHDARAFNREWQNARDISPILIGQDAHDGNCFVEFFFWGGGYVRNNEMTLLRPNWLDFSGDVSRDIEQEAKRRLGLS